MYSEEIHPNDLEVRKCAILLVLVLVINSNIGTNILYCVVKIGFLLGFGQSEIVGFAMTL
jgi:hypothetical protein